MQFSEQLIYALIACAIMLGIGFPIHEFSHALAAFRLGDSTARWQGRLTLDPRVHFDPFGGLMLLITAVLSNGAAFFGYAKPTPVNPMNLSGGRRGEALVAAAGPLSNLIMATVVAIPLRLIYGSPELIARAIETPLIAVAINVAFFVVWINVVLCIFNLLPVPPLDGWRAALGLASPRLHYQLRAFEAQYAQLIPFVFLIVIIFLGPRVIGPIADTLIGILLGPRYGLLPVQR
jgi:Zn-dependent protease